MKKHFVSYQIEYELKNLGFNETCLGYSDPCAMCNIRYAPLWQQVIDWFREKKNIIISNDIEDVDKHIIMYKNIDIEIYGNGFYNSREKAILKVIELVKEVNNSGKK